MHNTRFILRMALAIICLLFTSFAQTNPLIFHSKNDYQQKLADESEISEPRLQSLQILGETYETPAIVADSLALVALYNSTNGPGWTVNSNWLTGPLHTWHGITVSVSEGVRRVVSVALYNNNLVGNLPAEIGDLTNLQVFHLFNNQLTGNIPNTIGNLTQLRDLYASGNQLNGNIPVAIGNLTLLENLNLTSNQLTGSIPTEIGNLTNLKNLMLGFNLLSGSIPHEIGNLEQLQLLSVLSNLLTGNIPSEIGNLSLLTKALLAGNRLTGNLPSEIGNLSNLEDLLLYNNQLSGELPPTIGNLANLKILFLSYNSFSGAIPAEIGNLYKLTSLNLDGNQFTGNLPHELYNLFNLTGLQLNNNLLTGTIHNDIGNLNKLQVLTLSVNMFDGDIPQEICDLTNLQLLNLHNCKFQNIPDLNALTNLTSLLTEKNKLTFEDIEPNIGVADYFSYSPQDSVGVKQHIELFTGDDHTLSVSVGGEQNKYQWYKDGIIITGARNSLFTINNASLANRGTYMCHITNLIAPDLILYSKPVSVNVVSVSSADSLALVALYNSTNGPGWAEKNNWLTGPVNTWEGITVENSRVTRINKVNNNLAGPIPEEIGNLTNLQHLDLSTNYLTGSIPASIEKLTKLDTWMTSGNNLTGSIPKEIGNMTNLHIFYCGTNQLTGSIPKEIGNLANLEYLGISTNQLSGNIPAEIGNLSNLKHLGLNDNQFSGNIPAELGNLTNLTLLNLTDNQLTGSIPQELGNLTSLTGLSLGKNKLTGEIPAELENLTEIQSFDFSYNQLTGPVPAGFANITTLMHLYVQSNHLENLPDLKSLIHLDFLYIQSNKFTFGDIEPNIGVPKLIFEYIPQDSVGTRQVVKVSAGETLSLSVNVGGSHNTYHWFKDGVLIPDAQNHNLSFTDAGKDDEGVYTCWIDNTLVTDLTLYARPIIVKILPRQPGVISGSTSVCSGSEQSYSIDAVEDATSYTWTLPSGWTGSSSSNSITVTPLSTSGNVTVAANNANGTGTPRALYVSVKSKPAQPSAIAGNVLVCEGSENTYSISTVSGATSYNWTLPSGWTGTSTTNSITGVASASGTISVKASNTCGTSNARTLVVSVATVPEAPLTGDITQPNCETSSGSVLLSNLPETGSWTITGSPGSISHSGTGSSTRINNLNPGTYTFTVTNESGCTSPATGNVIIDNAPEKPTAPVVKSITQPTCSEATGSVVLNGLPASGTWLLTSSPAGILKEGTGTETTITGLNPGVYVFTVVNRFGCTSMASAEIEIDESPVVPEVPAIDSIVHPDCMVHTGSIYLSNLPAEGNWTLNINSGSSTYNASGDEIILSDMVSGTYSFTVTNEAGCTSAISEAAEIDAQPEIPATPTISENDGVLHSDATSGNQWYNENGPIPDADDQDYTPTANGNYYVVVSNGICSSEPSNIVCFGLTGTEPTILEPLLVIYPSPVSDKLTIEIKNQADKTDFQIINAAGNIVVSGTFEGKTIVNTAGLQPGIYMIKIQTTNSLTIQKIVKE